MNSLIIVTDHYKESPCVVHLGDIDETQVCLTHDYETPEAFEQAVPYRPSETEDLEDRPQSVIILNHEEAYELYLLLHELFKAHRNERQ